VIVAVSVSGVWSTVACQVALSPVDPDAVPANRPWVAVA
jgi:hypothetical protein